MWSVRTTYPNPSSYSFWGAPKVPVGLRRQIPCAPPHALAPGSCSPTLNGGSCPALQDRRGSSKPRCWCALFEYEMPARVVKVLSRPKMLGVLKEMPVRRRPDSPGFDRTSLARSFGRGLGRDITDPEECLPEWPRESRSSSSAVH